jgi:PPOX class probable F420-dependent enzyme
MDREEGLRRLSSARVAHLATADRGSLPHVIPVVFAVSGETIYWAVDDKPKSSRELKRLANIRANPNVQLVVDRYEEDWALLWWVRVTGHARIVEDDAEAGRALELLTGKYPQYRADPPPGPVVAIDIARVSSWEGRHDSATSASLGRVRRRGTPRGWR